MVRMVQGSTTIRARREAWTISIRRSSSAAVPVLLPPPQPPLPQPPKENDTAPASRTRRRTRSSRSLSPALTPPPPPLAAAAARQGPAGETGFNMAMLPRAKKPLGSIIYAAFVAIKQNSLKRLLAYSGIGHPVFVFLKINSFHNANIVKCRNYTYSQNNKSN
jgi:hypothetical protein